jgi:transcriptional regulator with XRE-family HTH domain
MNTFAQRLLLTRRDEEMNQDDLALKAGVSQSTISRIERGVLEDIPLTTIEALAKALGVRPEYLAGWSDDALGEDRPANVAEGRLVYDAATPEERQLIQEALELLHELSPEYQRLALQLLGTFRKAQNVRIIGDE